MTCSPRECRLQQLDVLRTIAGLFALRKRSVGIRLELGCSRKGKLGWTIRCHVVDAPVVRTGLTAAFFPDALLEACWCKPWRLWLLLSEVKREGRAPGRSVLRCENPGIPWWQLRMSPSGPLRKYQSCQLTSDVAGYSRRPSSKSFSGQSDLEDTGFLRELAGFWRALA